MQISTSELIGRDAEVAALRTALTSQTVHHGRAMFVLGDSGMGKTRIAAECAHLATARGMRVMRGRTGGVNLRMPLRPLVEALSSLLRDHTPPDPDDLGVRRAVLARLLPQWRTGAADENGPFDLLDLSEAMLRLVSSLSRDTGCLLVLEDLHDADPETLAVVEYLVDNLDAMNVLLVGTLRPLPGPALDLATAAGQRGVAELIPLPALAPTAVRALAATCLSIPDAKLPDPVAAYLIEAGGGNPYVIEALLSHLVEAGTLARGSTGWQVHGDIDPSVPDAVVRGHQRTLDRLPPTTRRTVLTAAVLGERFLLSDLGAVTGTEEHDLIGELRAAAELVSPDPETPGGYAFRHTLTAEALTATLHPVERAELARQAAGALRSADPALAGEHCHLVARLLAVAGDVTAAAAYREAGTRALEAGTTGSAVALLRRATELAADHPERAEYVTALVRALADDGQLDEAMSLADSGLPEPSGSPADPSAHVRVRLAWNAIMLGRMRDGATLTRHLPESSDDPSLLVVRAYLAYYDDQADETERVARAEEFAVQAATRAERTGQPEIACQAWQFLGLSARTGDLKRAGQFHERMLAVADRHHLTYWRADALVRLASNEFMRTGSIGRLLHATAFAHGLGAGVLEMGAQGALAMAHTLRAEHSASQTIIDQCVGPAGRMKLRDTRSYFLLISAIDAAQRAQRRQMRDRLTAFEDSSPEDSFMTPLAHGLARAFCAMLEEDRDQATADLVRIDEWEKHQPNLYVTTGRYGLHALLRSLRGELSDQDTEELLSHPATHLVYNAQFAYLADAVRLGRAGEHDRATARVHEAQTAGSTFPVASHLGLRLIAEEALTAGWGEPTAWLRSAESYFDDMGVASVASACRVLLRACPTPHHQRRRGVERIPEPLRALGVTVREYEVLALMRDRPTNQEIARRLYISPRTAEKHVASLITKLGVADRATLARVLAAA
ncbi:AAA family ATPase [Hamadaea sp. NPDC050747]|uniref:helix-turn-helix transcriptional regulator n=1 Tax=Hamadaea sp. NPDC050747 TaxID=3155789 RepID=UPI0033CE6E86